MKFRINIVLKSSILDPQGEAIKQTLKTLNYQKIDSVTQGKIIEIEINENDLKKARQEIVKMTEGLLANSLTEEYWIEKVD
jgi:phosphoribosylformylglycinamidine synthase